MTRREFLDRLDRCLAELGDGERASMVEFYREQIDDRVDDGMTEEEAVASLESPEDIAANILALRAEAGQPDGAAGAPNAGKDGAGSPGGAAGRKHPVLRGLGKAILGFFEVIVGIMLLPVAIGTAACVVAAYVCLWVADVVLALSSIAFMLFAGLVVTSCFVAPAATGTVAVATGALVAGALGMAVLVAVASYFFGKLLVMLIVWPARGLKRRSAAKQARRAAEQGRTAGRAAADYPSMPMPPSVSGDAAAADRAGRRRRMPLWGEFSIVAGVLVIGAFCAGMGAVTAAGGPEGLLEQAGVSETVPLLAVNGDEVDTIDLTLPTGRSWRIALGTSPDGNVYVRGWDAGMYGFFYWGDIDTVAGVQNGSTVRLEASEGRKAAIQNPFSMMGTQYVYGGTEKIVVLVPEGWEGDIVCSGDSFSSTYIRTGAFAQDALGWEGDRDADTKLVVDGDIDVRAAAVSLAWVEANAVDVTAPNVSLYELDAAELSVNVGQTYGRTSVDRTEVAGAAAFGGSQVEVDGLTAASVDLDERTYLVEEGPLQETGTGAAAGGARAVESASDADDGADVGRAA